jgi:uncharacterized protein
MNQEPPASPGPGAGRRALITGASSGIGRDLALLLAQGGFSLVLSGRDQAALDLLAQRCRAEHHVPAEVVVADLRDPASPALLHHRARPVDVLVNNAGFGLHGPFARNDPQLDLDLLQVNIAAPTHLARLFLPDMIQRRWGRILNVASTAAFAPGPYMSTYYASKAYVLSHSLALARELRGTGVTVSALCPGPTRTAFQQRARMDQARMFRLKVMDSMPVARAGYEGMLEGRTIIVPGLSNKLAALASRLVPRTLLARLVAHLNRP